MKQKIAKYCKALEKEYGIKILFAIESGSRLWRMESKDSDYDIRFVFVQKKTNYLSLQYDQYKNMVIEKMYDNKSIDLVGFDMYKFCKLLLRSNPTIIEWIFSDILYYGKTPITLRRIVKAHYNPQALYYHYQNMCKKNYLKYIASGNVSTAKKYLYCMRGAYCAQFVLKKNTLPPLNFPNTLVNYKGVLPANVTKEVLKIISYKKKGIEKEPIAAITLLDTYLRSFLEKKSRTLTRRLMNKKILEKWLLRQVN